MPISSTQIPLAYSYLPASPAVEICEDYALIDVNELICKGRTDILAYVVSGDSMADDIQPGNLVFIDTKAEPKNGDIVAVSINGRTCVKILEHIPPRLFLVPNNPKHDPIEVREADIFQVIGVIKAHLALH